MNITPVPLYNNPPIKRIAFLPIKSLLFLLFVPLFLLLIACQNPVSPGPPGPGPGPSGSHASSYTVTFKTNDDADMVFATKTVTSPKTTIGAADFPANPDRADYIFGGWNTDSGGTGTGFNASTTVNASITVYAQWTAEPSSGSYAVTFALNDGTPNIHAIKIVDSPATTIDALPDPPSNRTGYTFGGWNTNSGGTGTAFDTSTTVSDDITVYAKWNTYSYMVTFDKNGGETEASPPTKTVDSPATHLDALPAPPAWSGYKFTGWNTEIGGTGDAFNASTIVTGSITVFAQWTVLPPGMGKGSLSYNITVPATMSRGFLGLYPVDAPGFLEPIPEISFTSNVSGVITDIPEGKYKAVIDLYDGDNNTAKVWTGELQIPRNVTTPLTKTFNSGDFAPCPGLVGEDETTLAAKLDAALASPSGSYTIVLDGMEEDLDSFAPKILNATGNKNISITLRGNGGIVQLGGTGILLTLGADSGSSLSLALHDITLKGVPTNTLPLVEVSARTTLEMKAGSLITGNSGGGVSFNSGGTFTMSGGTVSGNTASSAGGVEVYGGTFAMNGGVVSGNIVSFSGGGVCVRNGGTFTMSAGAVCGNTAGGNGGGVYVDSAIFSMSGGAVSGNTASGSFGGGGVHVSYWGTFDMSGGTVSGNTTANFSAGGGVYIFSTDSTSFTKTGGIIYGYDASDPDNPNWNICKTSAGAIRDKFGHAAYYISYYRDLTLNTGDNISKSNLPADPGAENSGNTNWIKK
jgi:uncharacterized repeat protein (TIGR02543 family)